MARKLPAGAILGPKVRLPQAATVREVSFRLPFPTTLNTYWRHVVIKGQPRTLISAKGRAYRDAVAFAALEQRVGAVAGRVHVRLVCHPPDKRARDLDNLPKALLDAIKAAGVIEDDSLIDELLIVRGAVIPGGSVFVLVVAA